ncbi:MAG: hypothetical protein HZA91_11015 [Verrucomicrobia bacterium]|nr:hypothetical protein [Verrucomicrobiota bacterium]
MRITRPVVILLAVGATLGLFAISKKQPGAPGAKAAKAKPAAVAGEGRDARAVLDKFAALINQRDAAGLEAMIHRPFYADGKKFEDDQERRELIEKLTRDVNLPVTIAEAKAVTLAESGLPPEADQVLTADDSIFLTELHAGDRSESHTVVVRKTEAGFRMLAIVKNTAP